MASMVASVLAACAAMAEAQSLVGLPAKIEVVRQSDAPKAGSVAQLRLELLDPQNHPAKANKDITVEISGRARSGAPENLQAVIKAGESGQVIDLPLHNSGLLRVSASNSQLVGGETILNVRPAASAIFSPTPSPALKPMPSAPISLEQIPLTTAPAPTPKRARVMSAAPRFGLTTSAVSAPALALEAQSNSHLRLETAAQLPPPPVGAELPVGSAPAAPTPSAAESPAPASWTPNLTFDYTPSDHPLRAEIDAATIYAFLPAEKIAPWDMYVYLFSTNGAIDPIVIHKGENGGHTPLLAQQPARVTVKFVSSIPPAAEPVGGVPLQIGFGSPVAALSVRVNPPTIGLFETAEVILQLVNEKGIVVPTDDKRHLNVAIESGSGEIEESDLSINPNDSRATTHFVPTLPGDAVLTAWSPNLPNVSATVRIAPPYLELVLCAVGGLLGGLLAYWEEKPAYKHRIVVGLITGFVLYWAVLFLVIKIPGLPHAVVLNPASVLVLSLLGGWQGTKLLSFLAKRFGLA